VFAKPEQIEYALRRNTGPTRQRGPANRNTRTNTSMEDDPWADADRHWSDRDPQALLASGCLPPTLGDLGLSRLWRQQQSSAETPQTTT